MIWILAKKDLRLLVRDARALVILLAMPLIFILVLGVSLGEGFGQKAADKLRVSVLNLDEGLPRYFDRPAMLRDGFSWLTNTPGLIQGGGSGFVPAIGAMAQSLANRPGWFPQEPWSQLVLRDLSETANIRVEMIASREEAEQLRKSGRRAAVLILGPSFSKRVERCSFLATGWRDRILQGCAFPRPGDPVLLALAGFFEENQTTLPLYLEDGLNPFYRDGVRLETLDVQVIRDPTQQTAAAIIDQVAQGTMLRIVMPWMIGRAFEKIGDPAFLTILGQEEQLPGMVKTFLTSPLVPPQQKKALSTGLQGALQNIFPKYNLTAKTWAALTKELQRQGGGAETVDFTEEGAGWLKRGAIRYQLLVPSYLVMFAFFLVLTVGWLFVAERRQGTMKRLVAAPLMRWQILLGKLIPCLLMSLFQGFFILLMGRVLFGMSWGPAPWYLMLLVATTSLAAMGLALLVAAIARTETQVAIYGTLLVLVLAGLSGSLMGDRALMPEQMQRISRVTPHAWALDAYRQLLTNPTPELLEVLRACGVLVGFGVGFVLLAWWWLKLD
ncbi:MAG: ABC transporter permease [Planctomycetes bacterium]|nr:ABC transporter permease [Planctomycetota bacterium]